jgi:SAM-dependent methyltransferase
MSGIELLVDGLRQSAANVTPANVALMHLIIRARAPHEAEVAIARARDGSGDRARSFIDEVERLWSEHPDAWARVRASMAEHGVATADALARWASTFDRLAQVSPDAGVALYSLGSPELLAAATAEIADFLRARKLLGSGKTVLDLGCGSGRMLVALARKVSWITGVDIAAAMIAEARRRCAAHWNVTLLQISGTDLSPLPDSTFDLTIAVDVFPYMVECGQDVVRHNTREVARTLKPGGTFALFNYSYRGNDELDRAELSEAAQGAGMTLHETGERPFKLWDGAVYLLRRKSDDPRLHSSAL